MKTTGKEFFYAVSGLNVPKYIVADNITESLDKFVDWVPRNTDRIENMSSSNTPSFISEMESLYMLLCEIHARWLEVEAAKILRLAEVVSFPHWQKLIIPFITNVRTLALDIQMAQSKGFEPGYSKRSEIETNRDIISSMKIVLALLKSSDFDTAFDVAVSVDGLRDDPYAANLMTSITTKNKERSLMMTENVIAVHTKKIDSIIAAATDMLIMKRLLIVDDMPEMLTALSLMLKDYYQVFAFTEGQQALDFMDKRQQPDAFLLDIDMPGMDGFVLAKKIRSRVKHATTPIIFLTGISTRETFMKSRMYNAKAFIVKPADKELLISKLSSCLK